MAEKSLKKNAFYSFLKAFMTLVFPIITFPYVSRILNPDGIGKINFANSIVSYFAMLGSLGLQTYGIREIAKNRENQIETSKTVKELLIINLVSTVISYALFVLLIFSVNKFADYKAILFVCSLNIIFTPLGLDWYYRGLEDFKYITVRSFIFQLLSVIFLFLFVKTKNDLIMYAIVGIISSVGSNLCNIIHARKIILLKVSQKLEIKKHIAPIFVFFATSICSSIYTALDTSMIGLISTDAQVGFYSAANKINKITLGLITAIIGVFYPRLSYYFKQNQKEEFSNLANKSLRYILLLGLPCSVGLFVLAKPIILLFSGEQYLDAVRIMQIMTPIVLFISLGTFFNVNILSSIKKEKLVLLTIALGSLLNFTLNFFFIKKWQAFGAGLSTVITETFIAMLELYFTGKLFVNKQNLITLIKSIISCAVMFFAISFVFNKINSSILQILICTISGIIIYSIMLIILQEKEFLNAISDFKKKISKKG